MIKAFEVYHPNWGEWKSVEAYDYEDAANIAAEQMDRNGDYSIVGGSNENLAVREYGQQEVKFVEVYGESEPVYRSYIVDKNKMEKLFLECYEEEALK